MADIKINEINSITYSFDKKREKKDIDDYWKDKITVSTTDSIGAIFCIICDERKEISITETRYGPYICNKCKNAIMKVRKMFDE